MFAVNSFLPRVPYLSQYSYSILGQIQNDAVQYGTLSFDLAHAKYNK